MDRETWVFINTFAPWLAALGTITVVIVTLYFARRDKRIRLEVSAGVRLTVTPGVNEKYPEYLQIRIVNMGHREAQVTSIGWKIGLFKKKLAVQITIKDGLSSDIPVRLKDGEEASYYIPIDDDTEWIQGFANDFLNRNIKFRSRFISVCAYTSVGSSFESRIEKGLRDKLIQVAEGLNAKLS